MKFNRLSSALRMDERKEKRRRSKLRQVGSYHIGKAIGRGNFATVYLATHESARTKVAIKAIDMSLIEQENLRKIEREIAIMQRLDHPHIVKLYEVLRSERYLYIVTEFCRGGELFETIVERGRVSEDDAKKWFHQTALAVLYLHERRIVHRDLKAENILLDKNGDVKLIDFGFANTFEPDQLLNTWCGSPPYAAPELLLGNEYDGTQADVWSLGVLLYILVTGGFPFPGESVDKLKRAVLSGQLRIPFWVSVECSDLLRKMLVIIPEARCTLPRVLSHRFLHGVGSATKQPTKSINPALLSENNDKKPKLNASVVCFLQQHAKYTEEQIAMEVAMKNYQSPVFSAYEQLVDKLKEKKSDWNEPLDVLEEAPRRGSRGSIISGKVNVDPEPPERMISSSDLAVLNSISDIEEDSDDSSASESGSSSSFRVRRRRQLRNTLPFDDAYGSNRRYSEQMLSPLLAHLPCNAALQHIALQQAQLAMLAQQAQHFTPFPGFIPGVAPPMHMFDFQKMTTPNYERRASASEFPITQLLTGVMGMNSPQMNEQLLPSTSKATTPTIEEEGRRYLAQRGGTKRNTVHAVGGSPLAGGSPSSRHCKSPYQKTPSSGNGERRSSWASPTVTVQQLAYLEKAHRKGMQGSSSGINDIISLQREFQDLGRLTLGLPSTSGYSPAGLSSPAEMAAIQQMQACTPMISITDENNRMLGPPMGCAPAATFANLQEAYNQQANELLYGQRPATVIGFAPCNGFGQAGSSNASTPERPIPPKPDSSVNKMFTIGVMRDNVIFQIKSALDSENIPYEESRHIIEENKEMTCFRLSGTGIEIGVAAALPEMDKSHVEFLCVGEDLETSEALCNGLIMHLRSFETVPVV